MTMTRRQFVKASTVMVLLPTVGYSGEAQAGGFNLGGIGGALLQGLGGFSSKPIESLVQTGMSLAASALQLPAPVAAVAEPVIKVATSLFQPGAPSYQAAPVYVNRGPQEQNFSIFSRASSRSLQRGASFSDSDEQFLRADPYGYIMSNAEFLGDYINSSPGDIVPMTFRAQRGSPNAPYWGVAPVAYQAQNRPSGFVPSVSAQDSGFDLASILHDVAALAPLLSLFLL